MYLELYKRKEDEKEKPDLSTKREVTSIKNLENRTWTLPMASTPKVAKVFRSQVSPEAASSFISPSISRGKGYYLKKAIEKATNEKVCRICGKSTNYVCVCILTRNLYFAFKWSSKVDIVEKRDIKIDIASYQILFPNVIFYYFEENGK